VGPDWPERAGIVDPDVPTPVGEMDDMAAYARPGGPRNAPASGAGARADDPPAFDPGRVDDRVRRFYERTSEYEMTLLARWHRPFRAGAALAARGTHAVGQLALPPPGGEPIVLDSWFRPVAAAADPRDGARARVRTRPDGTAAFVAVYASHVRDGERFVNIAVPLPGGNLSTVLRLRHREVGLHGTGVELTTRTPNGGDPGLYLVGPGGPFALPMAQRFRVAPADAPGAPPVRFPGQDPALVATHAMWVAGVRFLTVEYAIRHPG
jgi:hypothetical protein